MFYVDFAEAVCIEGNGHLFFQCWFGKRIWKEILSKCLVEDPFTDWEDVILWDV
jgi:hypothetical protein